VFLKPLVLSTTSFKDFVPYNKEKQIKEKTFCTIEGSKDKIITKLFVAFALQRFYKLDMRNKTKDR